MLFRSAGRRRMKGWERVGEKLEEGGWEAKRGMEGE